MTLWLSRGGRHDVQGERRGGHSFNFRHRQAPRTHDHAHGQRRGRVNGCTVRQFSRPSPKKRKRGDVVMRAENRLTKTFENKTLMTGFEPAHPEGIRLAV